MLVATELDSETDRIVDYLSGFDIPINAVFIRALKHDDRRVISSAWLRDPFETEDIAANYPGSADAPEPWNGEY